MSKNIIENLKEYLKNTPKDKIQKIWDEVEKLYPKNENDVTISDYLKKVENELELIKDGKRNK